MEKKDHEIKEISLKKEPKNNNSIILETGKKSLNFTEISNNINNISPKESNKTHKKCNSLNSNEGFVNQMLIQNNDNKIEENHNILNVKKDKNDKKSHARLNTENFNNLIMIKNDKDNKENHIEEKIVEEDYLNELNLSGNLSLNNDDEDGEGKERTTIWGNTGLEDIIGEQIEEELNKQNDDILVNEENDENKTNDNNLINEEKNEENKNDNKSEKKEGTKEEKNEENIIIDKKDKINNQKYIKIVENNTKTENQKNNEKITKRKIKKEKKTGTKIDFVEEQEGDIFQNISIYNELSKYISKIDENINNDQNIIKENVERNHNYDILITKNHVKLYEDVIKYNPDICHFDNNYVIYSTNKGNIIIYSLEHEKIIKELPNPFKDGNNKIPKITSISSDKKFIICAYTNGKLSLFKKSKNNIEKSKLFISTQKLEFKDDIAEIGIYSGKKDRIIFYACDINGNCVRGKICLGMFKNAIKYKYFSICSNMSFKFYNLEINYNSYKCFGICYSQGISVFKVNNKDNKLIFNKAKKYCENYYPNFCFIYSKNKDGSSMFCASTGIDTINIYQIDKSLSVITPKNVYTFNQNIIKLGFFKDDLIYVLFKENIITLINCNSNFMNKQLSQKCIKDEHKLNLLYIDNFNYKYIKELNLYRNILCNGNGNIIINSKKKILILDSMSLINCTNEILKNLNDEKFSDWPTIFELITQVYQKKHPLWTIHEYNSSIEVLIQYIKIYYMDILIKKTYNMEDKIEKIRQGIDFLFCIEKYNVILNIQDDGIYKIINDDKIYFFILEPYILQNKFKFNKEVPYLFLKKMIDFYFKNDKRSWLRELLLHFDIQLFCQKYPKEKISLLSIIETYKLNNFIIYLILQDIENYKEYSYSKPIIKLLVDQISEMKFLKKCEIVNQFEDIICNSNEYKILIDNNNDYNPKIADFIENHRFNDEVLYCNYYLRIKFLWYIYQILFFKKINSKNKTLFQNFIDEVLEILLSPKKYEILEVNDGKNQILILDREVRLIINKILGDEKINELCKIDKENILNKVDELFEEKYISKNEYYLLYLHAFLDDNTLDYNKDNKLKIIFYFLEVNLTNPNYSNEKNLEQYLLELIKYIDSFTCDDINKMIKASNECKNIFPELSKYIINNFDK